MLGTGGAGHGGEQLDAAFPLGEVEVVDLEGSWYIRARRRCAELIRRIYKVDPLAFPRCGSPMRVIALIREPKVIDRILEHFRARGRDTRAGPRTTGRPEDGASTAVE